MIIKLYESIKKFIKENLVFVVVWALIFLSFFIRLDYEIYSPGGLSNLDKRITVEDGYESKGSFNLTYVTAKEGRLMFVLLSYIIPSWDLVSIDDSRIENEDYDEILARGKIDLNSVNENAIKVAFESANEKYEITKKDVTVYYIFEEAKTNLKVGDIIIEADGKEINELTDLTGIIENKNVGDEVSFKVMRDGKKLNKTGIVYESENKKIIGMYLSEVINVKTDKSVKFKYKVNESGASGGLMSTLEIYNRLVKEDITKGLTIAGTGTIDSLGNVGEIGGVKYKLKGAVKNKADVFIVPTANYEEALKEKEKNNYDIKLIEADTFKNVLKKLEEL